MKPGSGSGCIGAFAAVLLLTMQSAVAGVDHTAWDALLEKHVIVIERGVTEVDYRGMLADRAALRDYLDELGGVSREGFDTWPLQDQLAFLINAYNAWTVELILQRYPDLESIRDLGGWFRSPWKRRFIPLLGEQRSLDDIEHGLIRGSGRYAEPRIHFAVNCASVGCPALRSEAYISQRLNAQLDTATRDFLADRSRNRLQAGVLQVSSIFDWYRQDFAAGWKGLSSLSEFLAYYDKALELTPGALARLRAGTMAIEFLDYDWRLNDRGSVARSSRQGNRPEVVGHE